MTASRPRRTAFLVVQAVVGLLGLGMAALGLWLLLLGGTFYYLLAGLLLAVAPLVAWRESPWAAVAAQGLALALTMVWALSEIAGKGWMPSWGFDLAGRIGLPAALLLLSLAILLAPASKRAGRGVVLALGTLALVLIAGLALVWERPSAPRDQVAAVQGPADTDWTAFGGTNAGTRFSPAAQVTPANVNALREAWRFSTGDLTDNDRVFFSAQNTPLKIGDTLYLCSARNRVFALDCQSASKKDPLSACKRDPLRRAA